MITSGGGREGAIRPGSATLGGMAKHPGERFAADRILDVTVYAPLGLALSVLDAVPELARKGRDRLGPQVGVARTVGQLAVREGYRQFIGFTNSNPPITFTLNPLSAARPRASFPQPPAAAVDSAKDGGTASISRHRARSRCPMSQTKVGCQPPSWRSRATTRCLRPKCSSAWTVCPGMRLRRSGPTRPPPDADGRSSPGPIKSWPIRSGVDARTDRGLLLRASSALLGRGTHYRALRRRGRRAGGHAGRAGTPWPQQS